MTIIDGQILTRLENIIAETKLVAMIRQEPADLAKVYKVEFRRSYDDLDYLIFSTLSLPSGDCIGLIRHENSPTPGIEVCIRHDQFNVAKVLQAAIAEMKLTREDFTWIHPEYQKAVENWYCGRVKN